MKKVLIFSTNYLPSVGGAELAIKEITGRLPGMEFDLITPRYRRSLPVHETIGNIEVFRVGIGTRFDKFFVPIVGFLKALRLHRGRFYDGAWSMMASQASVAAALFKLFRRRVPLLLTLQEGDEEEHLKRYVFGIDWLYRLLVRPWHVLVFKVADRVSVISKHLEERVRRNNLSVPVVIVPNGVDVELFSDRSLREHRTQTRRELGLEEKDWVIVTVSRLVFKNQVGDIIRALTTLPPLCKLLIVGGGALEEDLRKLATELSVSERVVFAGDVRPEIVPQYLAASDVFVRPSSSEGLGSAFLEAMAAGVPVIATRVGGIVDFLRDKQTGLFCGVNDPRDLALKIQMMMRDIDLCNGIIAEARQMVSAQYHWNAVAARMDSDVFQPLFSLKPERILVVTGIYPPDIGGPAKYAKNLTDEFQKKGYVVRVSVFNKSRLPSGFHHFSFFLRLLIPVFLSDWILALDTASVGIPGVLASRFVRRTSVVRVGGDFLWEQYIGRTSAEIPLPDFYKNLPHLNVKERLIFALTRWMLTKCHRVIFSTAWQRDLWRAPYGLAESRVTVIENYYGEKLSAERPSAKNFVWAGRPIPLKNVERLRRAFALAKEYDQSLVLEVLSLPHDELMKKMARSYAIVLPSLSEVSPNLILEAVQLGRPFVVTKYCGILDRVRNFGVVVDPTSEQEITSAITSLALDKEYARLRKNLALFGFVHPWSAIAEECISAFKRT